MLTPSGDNASFLVFNRDPVDHMIEYLTVNFPENLPNDCRRSLAIRAGSKGKLIIFCGVKGGSIFSELKNVIDHMLADIIKERNFLLL